MSGSRTGRSAGTPPAAATPAVGEQQAGSTVGAWPNVVIRASAGTGKTFQLSNRYLQLLGAGEAPESILAVTFARKAAGEILARVVQRLAGAALDDEACRTLAAQVGWQLDRAACGQLLRRLLSHLHRLRIGTLDSFFVRLAGSFTLELGLPTGWKIVETIDDGRWRLEAIRLVLASGKTSDMLALVHLLFKGETVRSISQQIGELATNLYDVYCETEEEAWHRLRRPPRLKIEELAAAIEKLAGSPQPADGRFAKAWSADIERARDDDWEAFIGKGLAKPLITGTGVYFNKPIEPDLAALYRPLLDHAAGVLVGQIVDQTEATYKLLRAFAEQYRRIKHERAGLLFGDVPRLLADAIADGIWENASWRLDGSISHLLVDEFQDTALAQWRVLRPLATACCQGTTGRSFFSVGDVKQAIYRWRGGVSQIFDAARAELPNVVEESLTTSRRSCQVVIDAVNQVFGGLPNNAALADYAEVTRSWKAGFIEHSTAQTGLAGYVAMHVAPQAGDGAKPAEVTLRFAAERIAQLVQEHPRRSIGVLVRRNKAVRQLIHDLRSTHNLAASEEGGNPLVDSPAAQIILSALTLADHPGDRVARFHVAHSPLGPLLKVLDHADDTAAHRAMTDLRRQLIDVGYGRTLYQWAHTLAARCDEHDLRRLEQLVALGYTFDPQAGVRPGDFVAVVRETKVEDPAATQVRVMTIHQAKGLEFDIVVLPELDGRLKGTPPELAIGRPRPIDPVEVVCRMTNEAVRELLPEKLQRIFEIWPREAVGESLCLLYVAMTRAVHALHILVSPTTKTRPGGKPAFPKTFTGILRSALAGGRPLDPDTIAYEHGQQTWDRGPKQDAAGGAAGTEPAKKPIAIQLRSSGKQRHPERRSPSDMEGGARVRLADVLRTSGSGLARGSLWHAWLERIEWLDEDPPDKELVRTIARSLGARLDVAEELADFWKTVLDGPIKNLLSRAHYHDPRAIGLSADVADHLAKRLANRDARLVVHRERRFALREGDLLLSGSLDRLVTWQSADGKTLAADVIDFKTDWASEPGQLDERVEFYRPQILAYRRAVERLYGLPAGAVVGRLVFLQSGVVRTVS